MRQKRIEEKIDPCPSRVVGLVRLQISRRASKSGTEQALHRRGTPKVPVEARRVEIQVSAMTVQTHGCGGG